jgi:hypothetical protein
MRRSKDVVPGTLGISAHPVAEDTLPPTGEQFLSLLIGQLKGFSEQIGDLPLVSSLDRRSFAAIMRS